MANCTMCGKESKGVICEEDACIREMLELNESKEINCSKEIKIPVTINNRSYFNPMVEILQDAMEVI